MEGGGCVKQVMGKQETPQWSQWGQSRKGQSGKGLREYLRKESDPLELELDAPLLLLSASNAVPRLRLGLRRELF